MNYTIKALAEEYGNNFVIYSVIKNTYQEPVAGPNGTKMCPRCHAKLSICGKPFCAWCGQRVGTDNARA